MTLGTRGLMAAVVLGTGTVGCMNPGKRLPPEPVKPLSVTPPKPVPPPANPLNTANQSISKNGTTNVPAQSTSGGTLRPTPAAAPPIDPPVLPTVSPPALTPKADPNGSALPPAPAGIDPKNITPPAPAKFDLPSLPN